LASADSDSGSLKGSLAGPAEERPGGGVGVGVTGYGIGGAALEGVKDGISGTLDDGADSGGSYFEAGGGSYFEAGGGSYFEAAGGTSYFAEVTGGGSYFEAAGGTPYFAEVTGGGSYFEAEGGLRIEDPGREENGEPAPLGSVGGGAYLLEAGSVLRDIGVGDDCTRSGRPIEPIGSFADAHGGAAAGLAVIAGAGLGAGAAAGAFAALDMGAEPEIPDIGRGEVGGCVALGLVTENWSGKLPQRSRAPLASSTVAVTRSPFKNEPLVLRESWKK
jgi:hypothetical protein